MAVGGTKKVHTGLVWTLYDIIRCSLLAVNLLELGQQLFAAQVAGYNLALGVYQDVAGDRAYAIDCAGGTLPALEV